MFHLGGDDVVLDVARASRPCLALPIHGRDARATQCRHDVGVVALRPAGSKNHIQRVRSNQLRHLLAGGFLRTVHSPQFTVHSKNSEPPDG
jgi:hypothetical protein